MFIYIQIHIDIYSNLNIKTKDRKKREPQHDPSYYDSCARVPYSDYDCLRRSQDKACSHAYSIISHSNRLYRNVLGRRNLMVNYMLLQLNRLNRNNYFVIY